MSWLGGKRIAADVGSALKLEVDSHVVVAFDSKLAARLAAGGARVTFVSDVERDVQRATTPAVALSELESISDADAAVLVGASSRDDRDDIVPAFVAIVADDANVALVDRVQRKVASRAALHGGLSRLEQRAVGRVVITSGCRIALRSQSSQES